MNRKPFIIGAGIGCALLIALLIFVIPLAFFSITGRTPPKVSLNQYIPVTGSTAGQSQQQIPTLTASASNAAQSSNGQTVPGIDSQALVDLYGRLNPGVVNIQAFISQGNGGASGEAAGSGFILDDQGHVITNNHVIEGSSAVTVIFYNGFESTAKVIGADADSDLAVLQVDKMADGSHALTLGDSDQVKVGEWVVAIGNPFGLGTSMSIGIVSATERMIASGVAQYNIPQAIQTDAAINPGNSGGPLLDLNGDVIGVNAQIATNGTNSTGAGVGFAIPVNVIRRVAPILIQNGVYQWPYIGVRGDSVNMMIASANKLDTQFGAYVHEVVPGGPADQAGLKGSTNVENVNGLPVPVGGDVVIEADGQTVRSFSDLLVHVAYKNVGDQVQLTIIRGGQKQTVTLTLAARPSNLDSNSNTTP